MPERLYIIGNGFDRFHGIPSGYDQFGNYVRRADRQLADLADDFLPAPPDETLWSRFEENLAYMDSDQLVDVASDFLMSPGDDNWRDSANHDYQFEIEQTVGSLSSGLKAHFHDWLGTLIIPTAADYQGARVSLAPEARYLSFNYTPTLTQLYAIPESRILNIHGKVGAALKDIVLGHGRSPVATAASPDDAGEDFRILEGRRIVEDYFRKTFKPARQILERNKAFFDQLVDVNEIYVLGHALSEVDTVYLQAIADAAPNADWRVSYYETPVELAVRVEALKIPWWRVSYEPMSRFL